MQDSGTGSAQKALVVTLHESVAKTTEFQLNAVTRTVMHLHIQNNKGQQRCLFDSKITSAYFFFFYTFNKVI